MIRLHRIRGRLYFVALDSRGEGLPCIHHRGAWRPSTYRSAL
jgi:hypothetical protein